MKATGRLCDRIVHDPADLVLAEENTEALLESYLSDSDVQSLIPVSDIRSLTSSAKSIRQTME